jgi:hypothetical protein
MGTVPDNLARHGTAHVRLYHPTVSLAVDMIPYIVPLPIAKHTT